MIPSLAATIIPGVGAGKVIQIGSKAMTWGRRQFNGWLVSVVVLLVVRLVAVLKAHKLTKEVLKRGGDEETAARAAETMAAAVAGLNSLTPGMIGGRIAAKGLKEGAEEVAPTLAKRVGKHFGTGLVEGTTELLEEPTEGYILNRQTLQSLKTIHGIGLLRGLMFSL